MSAKDLGLKDKVIALRKSLLNWLTRKKYKFLNSVYDFNKLDLFYLTPNQAITLPCRNDIDIIKLSHHDLTKLAAGNDRFAEQARLYFQKRGIKSVYGAYRNGELVHTSWVYTATEYKKEPFSRLALKEHEAEIVNCFTAKKYRGLGIYPYAINLISNLEFQNGIECIYIMADYMNTASRKGIIKAGFKYLGKVIYLRSPVLFNWCVYYRRFQAGKFHQ